MARDPAPTMASSARLVDAWLAGHESENTRQSYRIDLATFGSWCAQHRAVPVSADIATLTAFGVARQTAGDSDATLRRRWSSLSSFYRYAIESGVVASNPVDGIHRPVEADGIEPVTVPLSQNAVEAYLVMAAALDPRLDALVSMLVRDGIKVGEALAIDVDDIVGRSPRTSVTIRRNGKARQVMLAESTARAVRRCAARRTGQPLFTNDHRGRTRTPQRLSRFGADHLIRQLRGSNDERVTANELRRYFITRKHHDGVSLSARTTSLPPGDESPAPTIRSKSPTRRSP
ncbi:MAG: site-specific integrase [Ilumatobacteraceae bacterium]